MKICLPFLLHQRFGKASSLMFILTAMLFSLSPIGSLHAAAVCTAETARARIVSVQGVIEIKRMQGKTWQSAGMDTLLCGGDMIRSRSHSRAALRLNNDSMLRLDQKSNIIFPAMQEDKSISLLDFIEGAIHIITRTPKPFKIRTPFVNASVDGTEFLVSVHGNDAEVVVYEGRVSVSNGWGHLVLNDHETATIHKGQPPKKEITLFPINAVQWALYYPTILDYWQDRGMQDIDALIHQAGQLLHTGQVEGAQAIIQRVLQQEPDSSDAYALLAIIAVVQNNKDQALELATTAVTNNPESAVAHVALSYAQQAHFEIEAALESVQQAMVLDPQYALTWARIAELQMSLGELERARQAAQKATSLNPALSKTQTILGFANLLQIDTKTAKAIFQRAIELDQADPMPRLGLGLALIREGDLEAGRIELEIAASLDPANSLIRSYLGKAYFEEKRYPLSSTQFDLAKERDPKDPTPWLYDGIQKQSQNRPVEALRDIQKSIELNNNRAVYRSKLLLDRDEAARGSSLARIFDNLGFERRAVMETAKSLSFDPANHSAHRFLSDTYVNTPRHEVARVSELLQAQLLQPININPVQPHQTVADLNIITGTIPSATGFNEFSPLMERNRSQIVASGIVGSNSTFGNEIVASMLYDRASISVGQFHYETNGFRPNSQQNSNIYNAFIQFSVTPKLNVQAELRAQDGSHGDIILDFKREGRAEDKYHRELNENVARFGARYSLSSNQDLLFSGKYINRKVTLLDGSSDLSGFQFETQHLFRQKHFNSVMGGGSYDFGSQVNRNNYYIYTNTYLPWNVTASAGVSYEAFLSLDGHNQTKINPKFGLQWDITDKLRLRAAWFETTKAHLIAQQSLEPTQIAGFNQFLDDFNGTRSRRMGIGADYRLSDIVFGGVEASERKFKIPFVIDFPDSKTENLSERKELLYRAYLYWIPHLYWVARGEFQYEIYNELFSKNIFSGNPQQLQTLSVPVSIEYFHPNGLFSKFSTTFVHQNLRLFSDLNDGRARDPVITHSGIDSFFLVDLALGYRFANRRGLLSLEGKNLLNDHFFYKNTNFYSSEPRIGTYIPERMFFLKLTFNY